MSRRLRLAVDPRTWSSLASDAAWARAGACPAPAVRSPLDAPIAVRWPSRYREQVAESFVEPIKDGLAAIATLTAADIEQPYDGIALIEVDIGGDRRRVAIDYSDLTLVNARCAADVDTYFKFQCLREGYAEIANVRPGGYVASSAFVYANWCRLRSLRRRAAASSDVFGRFGLRWGAEVREAAVRLLEAAPDIAFSGGTRFTQHGRYMREMARSKVCVDMPGQGPFCCRMVDGMAMGCCVVARRQSTVLPVDLRDGVEIVYCRDDLSDLVDLCRAYALDERLRSPIEAAAARYFDEHLHPVRLAEHYLRTLASSDGSA
jgi:hypothetical protein